MPKLYYIGQRSVIFNNYTFLTWFFFGAAHSLVVFVIPLYAFKESILNENADNDDMWSFSVTSFTSVILIVTARIMVTSRYLTWINLVCIIFLSLGVYFCYIWATNYTGFSDTYASMVVIFTSSHYYLTVTLCVGLCYFVDLFMEAWKFEIRTNPTDFLRKIIHYNQNIEKHDRIEKFNEIYYKIKTHYIQVDFQREEKLEEKRDHRTNKYGVKLLE